MKRIATGAVVLATIPLLLLGFASAALAGGADQGSGVSTMRLFNDGSWTPGGDQGGVSTMRPFSDPSWNPYTGGVITMRPFSDPNWNPAGVPAVASQPQVATMRPFSDPNFPIHAQPAVSSPNCPNYPSCAGIAAPVAQPVSSPGGPVPLVSLLAGLIALVAAAGALVTIGRRKRLRPA